MSTEMLLTWLSPLLALVLVVGVVAVVALAQAEPRDVPEVARVFCSVFRRMVEPAPAAETPTPTTATPDEPANDTLAGLDAAVHVNAVPDETRFGDAVDGLAHTVLDQATSQRQGEAT